MACVPQDLPLPSQRASCPPRAARSLVPPSPIARRAVPPHPSTARSRCLFPLSPCQAPPSARAPRTSSTWSSCPSPPAAARRTTRGRTGPWCSRRHPPASTRHAQHHVLVRTLLLEPWIHNGLGARSLRCGCRHRPRQLPASDPIADGAPHSSQTALAAQVDYGHEEAKPLNNGEDIRKYAVSTKDRVHTLMLYDSRTYANTHHAHAMFVITSHSPRFRGVHQRRQRQREGDEDCQRQVRGWQDRRGATANLFPSFRRMKARTGAPSMCRSARVVFF